MSNIPTEHNLSHDGGVVFMFFRLKDAGCYGTWTPIRSTGGAEAVLAGPHVLEVERAALRLGTLCTRR